MVTWGTSTSHWQDYASNPIIESQNTIYDPYGISNPSVIKIGDQFHMWFHSRANSGRCSIFHAASSDGKQWNYQTLTPALNTGFSGSWDDLSVNAPVVIFVDSIYKMYYTGWRDSYGNWSIGLATSVDGVNWEKFPDPVIAGGQNLVGNKVTASEVIIIDNTYYLYFTSRNVLFDRELRVAKSNDGINWDILPNILMTKTQTWEGESIFYPTIIKEGNLLKMVYMTATESFCEGFGIAYSHNGIDWIKDNNNPIFTEQQTVNNYLKVCYPNLVKDNNKQLLYYTGFDYSEISFINVAEFITN